MNTEQSDLLRAILAGSAARQAGMAVYVGNRQAVAVCAFSSLFPTVQQLLGDSFTAAVMQFLQDVPPVQAELTKWSVGFARWLAQQPTLALYPYIAAVAELEWQRAELERAADARIDLASFQRAQQYTPAELTVIVNPNAVLMKHSLPVYDIWRLHQASAQPPLLEHVNRCLQDDHYVDYLYVSRVEWQAHVVQISATDYALIASLHSRLSLAELLDVFQAHQLAMEDGLTRLITLGALLGYAVKACD